MVGLALDKLESKFLKGLGSGRPQIGVFTLCYIFTITSKNWNMPWHFINIKKPFSSSNGWKELSIKSIKKMNILICKRMSLSYWLRKLLRRNGFEDFIEFIPNFMIWLRIMHTKSLLYQFGCNASATRMKFLPSVAQTLPNITSLKHLSMSNKIKKNYKL